MHAGIHPPPPATTAVDGTQPTGMHSFYHPQTKFAKVMFLQVSVHRGDVWHVAGGMHGRGVGVGGMHGRVVYMGGGGGMHGREGCMPQQTLRDTVNERAVRILLECILVAIEFPNQRRCRPALKILDPPLLIQNLSSSTSISHIFAFSRMANDHH